MSMPEFPKSEAILSREQAVRAILTSIAMEETALSHIINAEGEKIQYAIARLEESGINSDAQLLLDVNNSATSIMGKITDMQIILKNKQQSALDAVQEYFQNDPVFVDPTGPTGLDPTGPTGLDPTGSTGVDPTGATGVDPTGATGVDPTGTTGVDPTGSTGVDPTGTTGLDPTGSTGVDPTGSTGYGPIGPTGTDGCCDCFYFVNCHFDYSYHCHDCRDYSTENYFYSKAEHECCHDDYCRRPSRCDRIDKPCPPENIYWPFEPVRCAKPYPSMNGGTPCAKKDPFFHCSSKNAIIQCAPSDSFRCPPPDIYANCAPRKQKPACPPEKYGISAFSAITKYAWQCGNSLPLEALSYSNYGVELLRRKRQTFVVLPAGEKYHIALDLDFTNKNARTVSIQLRLENSEKTFYTKNYESDEYDIYLKDLLIFEAPKKCGDSLLSITLLSPDSVKINQGNLSVTEANYSDAL